MTSVEHDFHVACADVLKLIKEKDWFDRREQAYLAQFLRYSYAFVDYYEDSGGYDAKKAAAVRSMIDQTAALIKPRLN